MEVFPQYQIEDLLQLPLTTYMFMVRDVARRKRRQESLLIRAVAVAQDPKAAQKALKDLEE